VVNLKRREKCKTKRSKEARGFKRYRNMKYINALIIAVVVCVCGQVSYQRIAK
jgi:hypothetical protein